MNDRIAELLAKLDIDLYTDEGVMMTKILVSPKDMRQFAELIVKECAWIANDPAPSVYDHDSYKLGRKFAGIDVLKHFGVEE